MSNNLIDRVVTAFEKACEAICEVPAALRENTAVQKQLLSFRQELAGDTPPENPAVPTEPATSGKGKGAGGRKVTVNKPADEKKATVTMEQIEAKVKAYMDGELDGKKATNTRDERKEAWGACREGLGVAKLKDLPEDRFEDALKAISELPLESGAEDDDDNEL